MKKLISTVIIIAFALTLCLQSVAFAQEIATEEAILQEAVPAEEPAEGASAEVTPDEDVAESEAAEAPAVPDLLQQFKDRMSEGAEAQENILPAPANFAALLNDSHSIYLMWDKVPGAIGYALFYWVGDPESVELLDVFLPNTTEYLHSGLQTGVQYNYVIAAVEPDGTLGQLSWPPEANIPRNLLPAPKGIKAANAGYNSVKVTWGAVSGAVQYAVFRYFDSGVISDLFMVPSAQKSYVDKGLTTGKTYMYRVYAVDSYGDLGATMNHVKVIPKVAKPAGFKATAASGNKIKLSWSKSSGASGYYIYRATSKTGTYSVVKMLGAGTASYTDSKLTAGKTYYYKIVPYRTVSGKKIKGVTAGPIAAKAKA